MEAFDNGMVETLIIHDELAYNRLSLRRTNGEELSTQVVSSREVISNNK